MGLVIARYRIGFCDKCPVQAFFFFLSIFKEKRQRRVICSGLPLLLSIAWVAAMAFSSAEGERCLFHFHFLFPFFTFTFSLAVHRERGAFLTISSHHHFHQFHHFFHFCCRVQNSSSSLIAYYMDMMWI